VAIINRHSLSGSGSASHPFVM